MLLKYSIIFLNINKTITEIQLLVMKLVYKFVQKNQLFGTLL